MILKVNPNILIGVVNCEEFTLYTEKGVLIVDDLSFQIISVCRNEININQISNALSYQNYSDMANRIFNL